jgi:hypothetical protein
MLPDLDVNRAQRKVMRIACLGWGSLIWKPGDLPIRAPWNEDGPILPVEFARQSGNSTVSLVLLPDARPVRTLWVELQVTSLEEARFVLCKRENRDCTRTPRSMAIIGYWSVEARTDDQFSAPIGEWATQRNLDAVVWTALKPKWNMEPGVVPTIEQVIECLRGLAGEERNAAERYIRLAPRQVRTLYRERIEEELGWTHSEKFPPDA